MDKISNALELQVELQALLDYARTPNPSRVLLASRLYRLSEMTSPIAMEHATPEALKKYLQEHPKADPKRHKVKESNPGKGDTDEGNFSDLPEDMSKYTRSQHQKVVNWLAKKPTKDLRKRQDLLNSQIEKAYTSKDDKALSNLRVMEKHLTEAIDKREFGDD